MSADMSSPSETLKSPVYFLQTLDLNDAAQQNRLAIAAETLKLRSMLHCNIVFDNGTGQMPVTQSPLHLPFGD